MAKKKQKENNLRRRAAKKRERTAGKHKSKGPAEADPTQFLGVAGCRLNRNWREKGMAVVSFAQTLAGGRVRAALFLVDVWGVGIKDCFTFPLGSLEAVNRHIDRLGEKMGEVFEDCTEVLAGHLIWGGYYFGKEGGFLPPRAFAKCRKLVPSLPEEAWDRGLFGKDGERFILGDLDDLQRRSKGAFDPETCGHHFVVAEGPLSEDEEEP